MRKAVKAGQRPVLPATTPPGLARLVHQCWDGNPARRPVFSAIVTTLDALASEPPYA